MLTKIKDAILRDLVKNNQLLASMTSVEIERLLYYHPHSMRLTGEGTTVLKKAYDAYEFSYEDEIKLDAKHFLNLGKKMQFPYYMGKNKFILFKGEDAVMLKLHANDLRMWLGKSF